MNMGTKVRVATSAAARADLKAEVAGAIAAAVAKDSVVADPAAKWATAR